MAGKTIKDALIDGCGDQISRIGGDGEVEPSGIAHGADGAGRVIDERQRMQDPDIAPLEILPAAEKVDELAVPLTVESDGEGVDGEVAPVEVLADERVLHLRQRGRGSVELGPSRSHVDPVAIRKGDHRSEERLMRVAAAADVGRQRIREIDPRTLHDEVDVLVGSSQEEISDHAANQIDRDAHRVGHGFGDAEEFPNPGGGGLAQEARYGLADGSFAGHPVVEHRPGGELALEEPTKEIHSRDDAGGTTVLFDHDESVGTFEEEIPQIVEGGRGVHRGKVRVHDRLHRTVGHTVSEGAVQDLSRDHSDQLAVAVLHRHGVETELVDSFLAGLHAFPGIDREDAPIGHVDGGGRWGQFLREGRNQLFANLDRHPIGDPSRGCGGVASAAESLGDPPEMKSVDATPEDQIDVGWLDQHHDPHREFEGLDPAVDDVGGFLVVLVDFDHGKGDGDIVDWDLFRRLHDSVEQRELFGLESLENPAPDPGQGAAQLDETGHHPEVVGGGLAVGQPTGVLVDAHHQQRCLFLGGLDSAFGEEIRDDGAGGAHGTKDGGLGYDSIAALFAVVIDEIDGASVTLDQVPDLAETRRGRGVHHHGVLDGLAPGAAELEFGEGQGRLGHEPSDSGLL